MEKEEVIARLCPMKLEIEVVGLDDVAAATVLGNIENLVEDYSREIGLRRNIKIRGGI